MPTGSKGMVMGGCGPTIVLGYGQDGEAALLSRWWRMVVGRCRPQGIICLDRIRARAVTGVVDLVAVAGRDRMEVGDRAHKKGSRSKEDGEGDWQERGREGCTVGGVGGNAGEGRRPVGWDSARFAGGHERVEVEEDEISRGVFFFFLFHAISR